MAEELVRSDTWSGLSDIRGHIAHTVKAFRNHLTSRGYYEHRATTVISRVDPSVRFIGSTISVLKPYIQTKTVPPQGVFLVQPALRTWNVAALLDPAAKPKWTSYFLALGFLLPSQRLGQAARDACDFLFESLGVPARRAVIRASSQDQDLIHAFTTLAPRPELEIDASDLALYRHRYGMETVSGRNCNIALRDDANRLNDIGNIIVIEENGTPVAVEFATGVGNLLAQVHNLQHPAQASTIASIMPIRCWREVKLADALTASVIMLAEGLRPTARGRGRTLRNYLRSLNYLRCQQGWSLDALGDTARLFEEAELGRITGASVQLREWVKAERRRSVVSSDPDATVNSYAGVSER